MSQTSLIMFMVVIATIMVVFYFNQSDSVQDNIVSVDTKVGTVELNHS